MLRKTPLLYAIIAIPFLACETPDLMSGEISTKEALTKRRLGNLEQLVMSYRMEFGALPTCIGDLLHPPSGTPFLREPPEEP